MMFSCAARLPVVTLDQIWSRAIAEKMCKSRGRSTTSSNSHRQRTRALSPVNESIEATENRADITILLRLCDGLDKKAVEAVKARCFQPGPKGRPPGRVQTTIQ